MSGDKHDLDFERKDVEPESIVRAGAAVAIVTIVASVLVLFLFNWFVDRARKADPPNPPLTRHEQGRQPPEPRLQEMPFKDIAILRGDEQGVLDAYGWIDQKAGIAQIPVSEAMKIIAEKGLPQWAPVAVPSASPSAAAAAKGAAVAAKGPAK